MSDMRIAVIGAGVIGRTHIETLGRARGMHLSAIVDPVPEARAQAEAAGVPFYQDVEALIADRAADAVVVAAPNDLHLPLGLRLVEAGLPVLMEKPVASSVAEGRQLAEAVRRTGVPILVGHHRRHNPIIRAAKAAIDAGTLGELVSATVISTLTKPAPYFVAWRVAPGQGGPLLINATHEVDLLRHFWGPVESVTALVSSARGGRPVEDTAGIVLGFARGGIATISQTDAGCGPWAWDVTAGENRARFPAHEVMAHAYSGTRAALSLPDLTLWRHPATPDWTVEMVPERLPRESHDAYVMQLEHFAEVARGAAAPINPVEDGLGNMQVIDAVRLSAAEGRRVEIAELEA